VAVLSPPPYAQSGSYSALADRVGSISAWKYDNPASRLAPYSAVVARATNIDFAHSLAGSQLTVGVGLAIVAGTEDLFQWSYVFHNPANLVINVPDAPAGQSRRDLIVARVRDAFYSGAITDADLVLVQGTPAASNPQDPVLPPNSYAIKRAERTGTGAVTITDLFEYTVSPGGITPARAGVASARLPNYAGEYRDVANVLQRGTAQGGTWEPIAANGPFSSFQPTLVAGANTLNLGSTGTRICYWQKIGRVVWVAYEFVWGGTGQQGFTGTIITQLPPGIVSAPVEQNVPAKLFIPGSQGAGSGAYMGQLQVMANASTGAPRWPQNSTSNLLAQYKVSDNGGAGQGVPAVANYPDGGNLTINGWLLANA
jgi:hypothetical protein